jgi:predicted PurR-regulated permease PerM
MINQLPLTVKRSIELLGIVLIVAILVVGKDIIMPITMAFFISIMLLPIYRFLIKKKFPESLAIILPILLMLAFIAGIIWFFSAQISIWPTIFRRLNKM